MKYIGLYEEMDFDDFDWMEDQELYFLCYLGGDCYIIMNAKRKTDQIHYEYTLYPNYKFDERKSFFKETSLNIREEVLSNRRVISKPGLPLEDHRIFWSDLPDDIKNKITFSEEEFFNSLYESIINPLFVYSKQLSKVGIKESIDFDENDFEWMEEDPTEFKVGDTVQLLDKMCVTSDPPHDIKLRDTMNWVVGDELKISKLNWSEKYGQLFGTISGYWYVSSCFKKV